MKLKIQITLRFVVLGVFITTLIFLGVWPLENDLRLISGFHSESLYPIKSLNTKLNVAVKESFTYVVSVDTYEKEEFLKREKDLKIIKKVLSHCRANY